MMHTSREERPRWTLEAPYRSGWYWFRSGSDMEFYQVDRIDGLLCARSKGEEAWRPIAELRGNWLGPVRKSPLRE